MYSGAQISLYPMADDFVGIITGALDALDPHRERLRIETDDISTFIVGPPEAFVPAMRDLFVAVAKTGAHCVLSATLSRGCPGEPDDPICHSEHFGEILAPHADRIETALTAIATAPETGVTAAAQFSLYLPGSNTHMAEVEAVIGFIERSGLKGTPKHFCTRLDGDAGAVFAAVEEAFCRFGPEDGHVAIDLTVSANSPSPR